MVEIWDKLVKYGAVIAGAVAGIFGEWSMLMTMLVAVMTLDYVSGLIVAGVRKSTKTDGGGLDSKVGFAGLAKKMFIMLVVLLATLLDRALGTDSMIFQSATVCFYVANEGISILENAALIGVPFPDAILNALEQLKTDSEKE